MAFEDIDLFYEMTIDDNSAKIKKDINVLKDIILKINDELDKKYELLTHINEEKELCIKKLQNEINENNKIMSKSVGAQSTHFGFLDNNFTLFSRETITIKQSKKVFITTKIILYNNFEIRVIQHHNKQHDYFCLDDIDNLLYWNGATTNELSMKYMEDCYIIKLIDILQSADIEYNELIKYGIPILGLCFTKRNNLWNLLNNSTNPNKEKIIEFLHNC